MPRREVRWALKPNRLGLPFPIERDWQRTINEYSEVWRKAQGRATKTRQLDRCPP